MELNEKLQEMRKEKGLTQEVKCYKLCGQHKKPLWCKYLIQETN